MRVAELTGPGSFRLIDQPVTEPGPGEIQVRVRVVGICGSDMHYYSEGSIGDIQCVYPMVLGHEPTGEVVKTGAGVSGWQPGDRVMCEPAIYCYHCEYCRTGHHNLCSHIRFLSMPSDPGFLREYANLPAHNVLPLPAGLGMVEGTLFEPLAVVVHSMQFVSLRPGETAVVYGAGPIGLLTIAMLKICGASRVWAVEPVAHRRELALAVGADAAIDPRAEDPCRQVLHDTGQRGVDVSVDCAAKDRTINQCLHTTRYGGRVVITGIPSEVEVPLEFHVMRRKEIRFFNVRRSNHETDAAVTLLREHPRRFAPVLTHQRPLEEVADSFAMLAAYRDGVGKLTVTIG